jgi:NAD(P)-dependent dehydrogenase (short-subunit alcohol dehydrogenase family)
MATDFGLDGALAVVVGASEGIGAVIAEGLAEAGAAVVLGGRFEERLAGTAQAVEDRGGSAHIQTVDVRDADDVKRFAREVINEVGVPTVLVNSMGGQLMKQAMDVEVDEWDLIHETHLRGTFLVCQAFGIAMSEQGYGKVINLSSTYSQTVVQGRSTYSAAKAGISQLTAALALEWGPSGVRVNALAPGTTRTPRVERRLEADSALEEQMTKSIPLGRIAEPRDMVGPAIFLSSPMSDFVTGQTLIVDGGWARSK